MLSKNLASAGRKRYGRRVEINVLVTTFLIEVRAPVEGCLVMAGKTYLGKSDKWSSLKGRSFIYKLR